LRQRSAHSLFSGISSTYRIASGDTLSSLVFTPFYCKICSEITMPVRPPKPHQRGGFTLLFIPNLIISVCLPKELLFSSEWNKDHALSVVLGAKRPNTLQGAEYRQKRGAQLFSVACPESCCKRGDSTGSG